ncbi:MAG: sigma-54-dependent Fis family transcriptional regulator [Candidatus Marinimicrobia bacterium]|jgi:DNA-binding NtrC family response regulator|nr:sigma-54-dependent Fis family transcriptional regulator [Candidatus Neomarinimicrobiota bacterium]MBT3945634.1 sigma-54-dependent Fis family transcriptional regulator [Candidatus Neomarinimicrobiota bacterium]MBT4155409.1 sigma-54-dependent Fis family transcriptional regulator [Candidatus Neomarinimicrobiota bacterium]MBT4554868.1 sigma-54-dependent Fis family transcriptional regulator [Candidatus Neomarinimicrobiota bacterium]MBT4753534.1 sigma-54-dependent Fis family transcriptional regula|tara:strand:- start:30554 stop:31771 length:1218 start_codon:yes stop_codon:yes gene_type:complete
MIDIDRLQKQSGIIGTSEGIRHILEMISQIAPVDISALITGESGVGKEVVAKAIHKASKRNNEKLVVVNCGAIPEGIIESELFGHKRGSFTGAGEDRKGYFEESNKGTIFLDEIGEAPLDTQVKLLRVLESGEFMRVGEVKMRYTDVRVIAATNKNLSELVRKGNFRQDLYYRLKTVTVDVPALRNRVEDIGPLVERFALEFTRSNDILYRGFMPEAIRVLKQYEWPGNVRELKHFVEKILVFQKGERITKDIVQNELMDVLPTEPNYNPALPVLVNQSSDKAEIDLILRQLFMLKQDTEMIQKMMVSGQVAPSGPTFPMMDNPDLRFPIPEKSMEITDEGHKLIRDDAIGDMVIKDLEEEAITRSLQYFNNNRRKTAISLGMSERTLYRKIEEFGLEPKIKKRE